MKRETVWSKCARCGEVIPALDVYCQSCEMLNLVSRHMNYTVVVRKPGNDLGNRRIR